MTTLPAVFHLVTFSPAGLLCEGHGILWAAMPHVHFFPDLVLGFGGKDSLLKFFDHYILWGGSF